MLLALDLAEGTWSGSSHGAHAGLLLGRGGSIGFEPMPAGHLGDTKQRVELFPSHPPWTAGRRHDERRDELDLVTQRLVREIGVIAMHVSQPMNTLG